MQDPTEMLDEGVTTEARPAQAIRIVAVGRAGVVAAESLCGEGSLDGVDTIAVHTDAMVLAGSKARFKRVLPTGLPRGMGAGCDPSVGQSAAERDAAALRPWMEGARLVFVLTGLGAGTGSGASPVVARLAREAGALVVSVATLPFECEGRMRAGHALAALQALKAASDVVITVPNQSVLAASPAGVTALEVFAAANRLLVDGVRGVWQMLSRPGLVRVDFASLERLLRGRHSESVFAAAEARGTDRAAEVVERLLANPFLSRQPILAAADAVLISVTAGSDVPFAEIESVLNALQRQCDQAQVVTGTSVDAALAGTLQATLIVSIGGSAPVPESALPAGGAVAAADRTGPDLMSLGSSVGGRSSGGLVPPAPELSADRRAELAGRSGVRQGLRRKKAVQGMFNFDVVSKGRFEKTEATVLNGQDLDIPTFLRRGVALN